ncbi:nucleoside recognition protein [bacterium 1xD8-6]|nr:nucleoside recognition protein [bacterium D16-36]RKI70797.1 nucleoside recognition protein [bacterium 1xD8-6]
MLNYLWGFMIMIGLGYGIITGEVEALSNAAIDSAGEAVTLAVTMLGIMAMWTGLMEVARQAGLMERMTGGLRPVLHLLFPRIPEGHKAREYIAANIIANVLGLGWAATPMGLKAMKELAVIERERLAKQRGIKPDDIEIKKASDEMCTFLVINISSLQLIPVSVIAYRAQYGAVNPAAIVLPGLIATLVSTVVAVMFCRVMCRKGEK